MVELLMRKLLAESVKAQILLCLMVVQNVAAKPFSELSLQHELSGQTEDSAYSTLMLKIESQLSFDVANQLRWQLKGFVTTSDNSESAWDIQDFYWRWHNKNVVLDVGFTRDFWGVTESRHLVDVINQVDLRFDRFADARLSQPMVKVDYRQVGSTLSFYLLPCYRALPQLDLGLNSDERQSFTRIDCGKDNGELPWSAAVRWAKVTGEVDWGLAFYQGVSREPYAGFKPNSVLVDAYPDVSRATVDMQWTNESLLLKGEALLQHSPYGDAAAIIGGFEYSYATLFDGELDLSLLMEYLHDSRCRQIAFSCATMVGVRWLGNDVAGSNGLLTLLYDRKSHQWRPAFQYGRRFSDSTSVNISGYFDYEYYLSTGFTWSF
ncbi:MAG: hypothetical protein ACJA13_001665 [Paraglaciecola sp.]